MFGERLKATRQARKYTQTGLANVLDMDKSTFSKYEHGEREPSFRVLCNLCVLLDVSADYLLGLTDEMPE